MYLLNKCPDNGYRLRRDSRPRLVRQESEYVELILAKTLRHAPANEGRLPDHLLLRECLSLVTSHGVLQLQYGSLYTSTNRGPIMAEPTLFPISPFEISHNQLA